MIRIDVRHSTPQFRLEVKCDLPGRVNAIVGPSGAGKTSLLEIIAGIRRGAGGSVRMDDQTFLDSEARLMLPPEKRRIGFVPQDVALFPHMTARQNILFSGNDEGLEMVTKTMEIDHLLDRYPATLSGGEKQRVALARAIMARPRLLLLDEPFSALHQPLRDRLLVYLRRVRDLFGVPMIYVTHQILEALALADHAVALRDGRVIAAGPADEVLHDRQVAGRLSVENVLVVDQPAHYPDRGVTHVVTADGVRLVLAHDQVRGAEFPLVVTVSGDDVVVFREAPRAISARNVLRGHIVQIERVEGSVEMIVDTPARIRVRATRESADDLGLAQGTEVWLALRAHAIHVIG